MLPVAVKFIKLAFPPQRSDSSKWFRVVGVCLIDVER
ncbi:unnamed protein product, partial [Mesocestoides corti]|uniref:Uncharacterized protein n=1 Tax=Mesocestoides corti TaxID=53468 RepID=A0A0R3U9Z2_MESCO